MTAYYNENDPYAAQWLRNLVSAGMIAPGDVDERSIKDVRADDLTWYRQCHFFAGIGVWSYALRQAGWSDDEEVWTGSCPCQPFSSIGKRGGTDDQRHLWPDWFRLVSERLPAVVFGEQVDGPDGEAWLDLVQSDMESMGYAFAPVISPAAGYGAPEGRHRTYFVADSMRSGRPEGWTVSGGGPIAWSGGSGLVGHTVESRLERLAGYGDNGDEPGRIATHANRPAAQDGSLEYAEIQQARVSRFARERRATGGFWSDADWIPCRGGKWRPIQPGTFPLAHGVACRMDKIRAFGNAIIAPQAIEFIRSYRECVS